MKLATVYALFDDDRHKLARYCRVHHSVIFRWEVDSDGRIVKQSVRDQCLAAVVRLRADLLRAKGEELDPIEADLIAE